MSVAQPLTGYAADLHRYLQQGRDAHAEILPETLDGQAGRDRDDQGGADWWQAYVGRIHAVEDTFRD